MQNIYKPIRVPKLIRKLQLELTALLGMLNSAIARPIEQGRCKTENVSHDAPSDCARRGFRGGGYGDIPRFARLTLRNRTTANQRKDDIGFRLVVDRQNLAAPRQED